MVIAFCESTVHLLQPYTFSQGVDNISFLLEDIDSQASGWHDRVSIRAYDSEVGGSLITGITTLGTAGGGTGHATGTNGDGSNFVEGLTTNSNLSASVALNGASIQRIEISFEAGSQGFMPEYVGVGDFTFDVINEAPVAEVDAETTLEDTSVIVDLIGNDSDPDGDTLTVTGISSSADGSVVNNSDGTMTFVPDSNFTGSTTVTYTISDGNSGTATATATIDVIPENDAPVAVADFETTTEDTAVTVDLLANDSDPDVGDTLTVIGISGSVDGSVINNSDGTMTFVPDSNFTGSTTVTYTIADSDGSQATATATISVSAVNDAPVAVDDFDTTTEDTAVTVDLTGNDSDPDVGDTLTVTGISSSADGSIVNNSDGTLTFTPDSNFTGSTTVTYTISDGNTGAATATATISVSPVNDAPVAVVDTATVTEDTTATINVLGNDSDVDIGDALTVTSATTADGTVSINSDGTLDFLPSSNFTGSTTITYTISDGNLGTDSATVSVSVSPVNDAPVATPDTQTITEDTPTDLTVLTNDSDVDGDDLTVTTASSPDARVLCCRTRRLSFRGRPLAAWRATWGASPPMARNVRWRRLERSLRPIWSAASHGYRGCRDCSR